MPRMLSPKAELAVACIDIKTASQVDDAQWEPFQLQFLNNQDILGADVKSRQIAWSFTAAVDSICDSILYPGNPHTFVSINLVEAGEKIRYANAVIDAWHNVPGYPPLPKIVRSNSQVIEFNNGSRLMSYPCRPVRGLAKGRIYLDEMAHYRISLQRQIYTGAFPATTKGGYMRLGSSPLGASGLFWDIMTDEKNSPETRSFVDFDAHRRKLPWWCIRYLCKDVKTARQLAPHMQTLERVEAFATERLKMIFRNMFLEDFMQEYECDWVDESVAFYPWSEIQRNQDAFDDGVYITAMGVDEAFASIDKFRAAIKEQQIEPVLVGGIDIGRVHDLTELVILGKATTGQLPFRGNITLKNVEFDDQQAVFEKIIKALPFTQVLVDDSGIGAQLAENLEKKTKRRAIGVTFTNPNKELWAVEVRVQMQRCNVPIPVWRDFAYQIHSIKKVVTAAKNYVFDAERNEKGHADKFWAWALGVWAGHKQPRGGGVVF